MLLVARPVDGRLDILDRLMRSPASARAWTRPAACPRGHRAHARLLREYREIIDRHGAGAIRVTATSAARDAANRDEFFAAAEEVVGVRPELLSGDEEGRLSFLGATADLDPALGPFLVVDIGGGSTEFVAGTDHVEAVMSVDIGCVRLTEKFLEHDPPQPEELSASVSLTDAYLDDVHRELPGVADARTFVGLAGTVTTVAAVEIGLADLRPRPDPPLPPHPRRGRGRVPHARHRVARRPAPQPGPRGGPGRRDRRRLLRAGRHVPAVRVRRVLVSEADILDGLALSLVG